MKDIAIYGAGGFGKEVACLIDLINKKSKEWPVWNLIGFFDDGKPLGTDVSVYGKTLGGMTELNSWKSELSLVIAIAESGAIMRIHESVVNPNIAFPNLIHPDFGMADSRTFSIGKGNIIEGGCFASCDVSIGSFNVFNGSDVLGHDVKIGNYNVVMPNIRISGEVTIGNNNFFGVGSIILQKLKIGNGVRLGAGGVLMTKPKDGRTYLGNPAKIFKY